MPRPAKSLASSFSGMKAEYAGMQESRFRRARPGVSAAGGSADVHAMSETRFVRMREYVRAMDRDDFLIGQLTDRCVDNQVQTGFTLEPQTGDDALDAELLARFRNWADDPRRCDTAGGMVFSEIERLVARSEYVDGDVFALPIEDGTLQLIEADRCRTPTNSRRNIVHGVELDAQRRRLCYFFTRESADPLRPVARVGDTYQVPAFDDEGHPQVFHLYKPTRFSQTRGVTAFKAVIDVCGMIEDTNFATLVKQQMAACLVGSWENDDNVGSTPATGPTEKYDLPDGSLGMDMGISPGQMFNLPPGKKLKLHSSTIPGPEYFPHVKMLLTFVGVQLGMPLFLVLLDASETNFSGWRGAFDQAKLGFQANQLRRVARFYRPVYQWKVRQWAAEDPAIAAAARRSGVRVDRHEWKAPGWSYVQPLHDAQANSLRLQTGQVSLRRFHAEIGGDFETYVAENVADNARWIRAAIEATEKLKSELGVGARDLHWTHLYHRDYFRGGQLIDTIETPNDGSSTAAIKDGATTPAKK